jgi:hypothetical protein
MNRIPKTGPATDLDVDRRMRLACRISHGQHGGLGEMDVNTTLLGR